ncbi:hypothetical protein Syun_025719 [Stephania yunnanensis]|uniref:Uncharacterized protein n=1 Tax=Stephania yunnanensis TaxID=152371 RepID=A0AAP0ESP0_9MAGN
MWHHVSSAGGLTGPVQLNRARVLKGLRGFKEMADQELELELNGRTPRGDPHSVDDLWGFSIIQERKACASWRTCKN